VLGGELDDRSRSVLRMTLAATKSASARSATIVARRGRSRVSNLDNDQLDAEGCAHGPPTAPASGTGLAVVRTAIRSARGHYFLISSRLANYRGFRRQYHPGDVAPAIGKAAKDATTIVVCCQLQRSGGTGVGRASRGRATSPGWYCGGTHDSWQAAELIKEVVRAPSGSRSSPRRGQSRTQAQWRTVCAIPRRQAGRCRDSRRRLRPRLCHDCGRTGRRVLVARASFSPDRERIIQLAARPGCPQSMSGASMSTGGLNSVWQQCIGLPGAPRA